MWTLKSTPVVKEAEGLMMTVTFTFTDGTKDEVFSTTVSTEKEVKQSGRDLLNRLNNRSKVIAESKAGTFTIEEETTERVPTNLEKKQAQYDQVLADYRELKELHEMDTAIVSANDLNNKANAVKNARQELSNAKQNA